MVGFAQPCNSPCKLPLPLGAIRTMQKRCLHIAFGPRNGLESEGEGKLTQRVAELWKT